MSRPNTYAGVATDRRALNSGLLALCEEHSVAVLCYGAVAGGLLSDRWIGAPEPAEWSTPIDATTRSLTKYILIARGESVCQPDDARYKSAGGTCLDMAWNSLTNVMCVFCLGALHCTALHCTAEFGSWELVQELLLCLRGVATQHGSDITVAQVALAWTLQLPAVTSCIVGLPSGSGVSGSVGQQRSHELLGAVQIKLTATELSDIDAILVQVSE